MRLQASHDVLCNEDLLKLLFEKLGRQSLCSAGATCRQWRQVAESDEFWTSLEFNGLNISPWQVLLPSIAVVEQSIEYRPSLPDALLQQARSSQEAN